MTLRAVGQCGALRRGSRTVPSMSPNARFVQLAAMSCTASWWFLVPGVLLALAGLSGAIEGFGSRNMEGDCLWGCFGLVVLVAGVGLAGIGIHSFIQGCNG